MYLKFSGIQTHETTNNCYRILEARLNSFNNWPATLRQTPSQLAEAGFYYSGLGDLVKCFQCDGGLQEWNPSDDPWTEHALWFPHCSFVQMVKGAAFVESCTVIFKLIFNQFFDPISISSLDRIFYCFNRLLNCLFYCFVLLYIFNNYL